MHARKLRSFEGNMCKERPLFTIFVIVLKTSPITPITLLVFEFGLGDAA